VLVVDDNAAAREILEPSAPWRLGGRRRVWKDAITAIRGRMPASRMTSCSRIGDARRCGRKPAVMIKSDER
jgi:hypothetical protein